MLPDFIAGRAVGKFRQTLLQCIYNCTKAIRGLHWPTPIPGPKPATMTKQTHPLLLAPMRRVTSYDVASLAGVSQSAVSRAFKPGASVSKRTHAKVMQAARELEYTPNAAARSLITKRS